MNHHMMTSSNGNIFCVTGPLWGNSPVIGEFPSQRPVTRSFVFFDLRLIVLQNKIIRTINGIPPRTNVDNLYIKHNILSVKRLYSYNVGLFMYKYSNSLLPDVFDTLFCKLADVHEYNTRNASMQHIYVSFR